MRLHRLMAILLLIESRGHMKAKELAKALETSVRTIYRDIETLCEAGVPLTATTGPNGGIFLMEGYHMALNHLYEDDVINLYLCGIGIRPDGNSDSKLKLQSTLLKLEKSLPSEYLQDIKKARDRFYYDEVPWWGERTLNPYFEVIRRSVWQSKVLRILYGRPEEKYSERKVHPYGMVVKNTEWYLIAYCESSKAVRTFKCDRIQEAEMLEDSFTIPESFSLEKYWRESEINFKKERSEDEKYTVTIKLHKLDRDLLNRLEVFETHLEDDYIIAAVNMHKYEFACQEAMDIAGRSLILEPKELHIYVAERLKTMLKAYEQSETKL